MSRHIETDVVVVGGGGAGMVAAATAASYRGGVDVVLVERDERVACNTLIASNFIPAADTRYQRAAGIADSASTMAEDIQRKNGGRSNATMTHEVCRRSAEMIHWLVDGLRIELEFAPELAWVGQTHPRMHAHPSRSGVAVVAQLRAAVHAQPRLRYLDRTSGTGLKSGDSGVAGIVAEDGQGALTIHARKTVLTTGGFNANHEMVSRHIPQMSEAPTIGARSNTGDGILWAMNAGAGCALMSGYQGRDCISEDGTRVTPGVITEGGIAVDASGERFVDELRDYSELAEVYRARPGHHAVFVWDARIQELAKDVLVMKQAMERGGIARCDTVEDIAARFGLPAATLEMSIRTYNDGVLAGRDAFGRSPLTQPLVAPYYGARITGALAHTQGGLVADTSFRVLDAAHRPIPNLYAGGNTIAGLSGDSASGYSSGNGLLLAYVSGMVIGQQVVDEILASR